SELLFNSLLRLCVCFFFSSRRRHTRSKRDWSSDVCSSDLDRTICSLEQIVRSFPEVVEFRATAIKHGSLDALVVEIEDRLDKPRSEERRVGKECRARYVQYKVENK